MRLVGAALYHEWRFEMILKVGRRIHASRIVLASIDNKTHVAILLPARPNCPNWIIQTWEAEDRTVIIIADTHCFEIGLSKMKVFLACQLFIECGVRHIRRPPRKHHQSMRALPGEEVLLKPPARIREKASTARAI